MKLTLEIVGMHELFDSARDFLDSMTSKNRLQKEILDMQFDQAKKAIKAIESMGKTANVQPLTGGLGGSA